MKREEAKKAHGPIVAPGRVRGRLASISEASSFPAKTSSDTKMFHSVVLRSRSQKMLGYESRAYSGVRLRGNIYESSIDNRSLLNMRDSNETYVLINEIPPALLIQDIQPIDSTSSRIHNANTRIRLIACQKCTISHIICPNPKREYGLLGVK